MSNRGEPFECQLRSNLERGFEGEVTEDRLIQTLRNSYVTCPVCGETGQLNYRLTGHWRTGTYRYWYVRHQRPACNDDYCYVHKEVTRFIQDVLSKTKQSRLV